MPETRFGAHLHLAFPDPDERIVNALHVGHGFEEKIERLCQDIVDLLAAKGYTAKNWETVSMASDDVLPLVGDYAWHPTEILVGGDWLNLEEILEEDGHVAIEIRIPFMKKSAFLKLLRHLRICALSVFGYSDPELGAPVFAEVNNVGYGGTILVESETFSMPMLMGTAPETLWRAFGNQLHDEAATTLRDQAGPQVLSDMTVIDRESYSLHAVRNALCKTLPSRLSAASRISDSCIAVSYFSSFFILSGEVKGRPSLPAVLKIIEGCSVQNFPDELSHPSFGAFIDKIAVALSWLRRNKNRITHDRMVNHGELSNEGSMTMVVMYDDELALVYKEETGTVHVPSHTGEYGDDFIAKAGYGASQLGAAIALSALDLAEIAAEPEFKRLPILSQKFAMAAMEIKEDLEKLGYLERLKRVGVK